MQQENEDCYFYYYSTCNKGETCPYRHEPMAKGTEDICENWEYGDCRETHCTLRHMRIQMNRATVKCYWESQPSGCQKAHCVFKHFKPRHNMGLPAARNTATGAENKNTASVVNSGLSKDVPSPKVDQILISVGDTDEESPQIQSRIKPAVSASITTKKISLRNLGNKPSQSDAIKHGDPSECTVSKSSKLLEDELLECAKKGIVEALDSTLSCSARSHTSGTPSVVSGTPSVVSGTPSMVSGTPSVVSGTPSVVKVKTLKDIKRENILKARLEYERKKLIASQQEKEASSAAGNSHLSKSTRPVSRKTSSVGRVKWKNDTEGEIRTPSKRSAQQSTSREDLIMSKNVEVSGLKPNNIETVKVKSFSEIMEEKRKRLRDLQSEPAELANRPESANNGSNKPESANNDLKKTEQTINRSLPIIPARKMRIRSVATSPGSTARQRGGTRLKRSLPSEAKPDETSKMNDTVPVKMVCRDSEDGIDIKGASPLHNATKISENSLTCENFSKEKTTSVESLLAQHIQDERNEADIEGNLSLLDNSSYLKGDDSRSETALHIDDDDLMNEMEQLLA